MRGLEKFHLNGKESVWRHLISRSLIVTGYNYSIISLTSFCLDSFFLVHFSGYIVEFEILRSNHSSKRKCSGNWNGFSWNYKFVAVGS